MSNLTDALIAAKLVGGSGGSGGGSGLPSTTYYIMQVEPAGNDSYAGLTFYRPNDEERIKVMSAGASVEMDNETGDERLVIGEVIVNPEADPPITDADIAAIELKLASWQNDSYGGAWLFRLITGEADGEVSAEFYVYPYIL